MRVARTTKLSFEQVEQIRARVRSGERQSDVARSVGVKPCTVNKIVRGARRLQSFHYPSVEEVRAGRRQAHKRWRDANIERVRANGRASAKRRKNLVRSASGKHSLIDICRQYAAQSGRCFYCHRELDEVHVDHKTPIVRGGSNGPENIVCACARCNARKGTLTAEEFRGKVAG